MNGKSDTNRIVRNGQIRTKLSPINASDIPTAPYEWKSKLPELLLIVGLLETRSAKHVAALLRTLGETASQPTKNKEGATFGGTVSELAQIVQVACEPECHKVVSVLEQVFQGPNLSLLKIFELPGKVIIQKVLGAFGEVTKDDYLRVMRTTGAASNGQSGRATRAKLVQLILWDPDDKKLHLDPSELERLGEAITDDVLGENACSVVRATWAVTQGDVGDEVTPWVRAFWQFGLANTPCLHDDPKTGRDRIRLSPELKSLTRRIDRLWRTIVAADLKHDLLSVSDVTMGLTCRIWRFMHHIVEASGVGNGEMAEIAARCQWDSVITFEWLVKRNDPKLFWQYRVYSAGKSKATLERLRTDAETYGGEKLKVKVEPTLVREVQEGAGIWEQLVNEERGGWASETTHKMAEEMLSLSEYEFYFRRLSDVVHGTWRALERYHLRPCLNPLHGDHHVAWAAATHDAGVSIIHFGIAMATRAIRVLIGYMGGSADSKWNSRLEKIDQEAASLRKRDLAELGLSELQ